jgi:hypothetical protein
MYGKNYKINYFIFLTKHFSEEFNLLGYKAVQTVKGELTFRRYILPPSSGLKIKQRKKRA